MLGVYCSGVKGFNASLRRRDCELSRVCQEVKSNRISGLNEPPGFD